MDLLLLSGKVSWFGKNSGYDVLTDYISDDNDVTIVQSGNTILGKIVGKVFQRFFKWSFVNTQDVFTELKFLLKVKPKSISHILHIEPHIQILEKNNYKKGIIVGTIHLPINQWKKEWLVSLGKLDEAIILYEKEINLFSNYLPKNKIHFIRHGININFFKPGLPDIVDKKKILIVGHYLRNFNMLLEVYHKIINTIKDHLEFHVVIPFIYRNNAVLAEMAKSKSVFFYEMLSDQQLLELYQSSYLLLIPMQDSGANSAIVQSLAVGLPVITTDVGGIRSYGGGEIYPVIENDNINEMVSLFEKYYNDVQFRNSISIKIRTFAEEELDWEIIAKKHLDLFKLVKNQLT